MECLRDSFYDGAMIGGRYETVSPLNHGSFGMVFMARDTHTNQTVAIKCLTKKSASPDEYLDFAIDDKSEELVLHGQLDSHPNIVNLLDSFETEAHIYLVLEFCPRGDLYEAIRIGHGPLETEHVRRFMLELVDAVAYIHAKGIYHRDIKPENIFLTQDGSMKLGDFGLATTDEWSYETTVGSDRYMSPEQFDSAGAGYSPPQADVWAIGVCLLNILFSRNPFTTPTEADPLFLDFSRDKQSLFDVFPSMSQDTFEVIVQCMNLDPTKRSLEGARDALERVVSFTTLDEVPDDFCSSDRRVVASSNREPLRTPSIQSPQVDTGAFPWAKALHATPPKAIRQLSVIPDDEMYEEDLFSKSGATTDWMSGIAQTPSLSSYMDSNLGGSTHSFAVPANFRPVLPAKAAAKLAPMAGSLPINVSKSRNASAMSLVFGRKDAVSKSWSDLWDEEFEEEEEQQAKQLQTLKEMNSRTWSHESTATPSLAAADNDDTPRQGLSPVTKSATLAVDENAILSMDGVFDHADEEDPEMDGLFLYEAPPAKEEPQPEPQLPRNATPSRSNNMDKWAALGERRRAHGNSPPPKVVNISLRTGRPAPATLPASSPIKGRGTFALHSNSPPPLSSVSPNHHHYNPHQQQQHHHHPPKGGKSNSRDRNAKECPRHKGRDREWNWNFDWRKEKRSGFGYLDWVGNWQTARS
ncbi:kinase-like domain-containing protein [Chaetomium sp. MPI-SDFR-AT-0129]|nr:kinase-like domain-containing protein [Chaetomium sp. MPI-SDFR-AT-0129]